MKNIDLLLILAIIISLIFLPSLDNFFNSDNFGMLENSKLIVEGNYKNIFYSDDISNSFFRPVVNSFLTLHYYLFGPYNATPYHITSTIIHIINIFLVFYLARLLIKNDFVAFVGALFFGLVGTHSEAVLYITLPDIVVTFFYLLTLIFFILYLNNKKTSYYVISIITLIFALLSKEPAITIPPALFLYEVIVHKKFKIKNINFIIKYIPYIIITAAYFLTQLWLQLQVSSSMTAGHYKIGFHFIRHTLEYATSLILSLPQLNFITDPEMFASLFPSLLFLLPLLKILIIILLILVPIISIIILIFGSNQTRFLLLWAYLAILPFTFFVWGNTSRYTYIPSIGYSILLAILIFNIYKTINNKVITSAIIILLVILFSATTLLNEKVFDSVSKETYNFHKQIRRLYPDFPENAKLYFIGLPDHMVGNFNTGSALRIYYNNPTIKTFYPEELPREKELGAYYFKYENKKLTEI